MKLHNDAFRKNFGTLLCKTEYDDNREAKDIYLFPTLD
jgi:hypothetical protein